MRNVILFLISCVFCYSSATAVELSYNNNKSTAYEQGTIAAELLVKRTNADSTGAIIVLWSLDTSATKAANPLNDYTITGAIGPGNINGSITLANGVTEAIIYIVPTDDSAIEGYETVTISLVINAGYTLPISQSATIVIADNDISVKLINGGDNVARENDEGLSIPPIQDPDANRRRYFRAEMTPGGSGLGTKIKTKIIPGENSATLGTDYVVEYKIGGKSMGDGQGYTSLPTHAYDIGATSITIHGNNSALNANDSIYFENDFNEYFVSTNYAGGAGNLTLSSGLLKALSNNAKFMQAGPTGFSVNQSVTPPLADDTTVTLTAMSGSIDAGSQFIFSNHSTIYTSALGLGSSSGDITFTPALTNNVPHGATLQIISPSTTYRVNKVNSIFAKGLRTLTVNDGIGGFAVGDVIRLGTVNSSTQYVITQGFNSGSSGTITFVAYTGPGYQGGIPANVTSASLSIFTHFPAVFSGTGSPQTEIHLDVPGISSHIDYGIIPTSDSLAEASEYVYMALLPFEDYTISDTSIAKIIIADDDVTVGFSPIRTNATVGGAPGQLTVVLVGGTFPRPVTIPYNISGTAVNDTSLTTDISPVLLNYVTIPANTATKIITVNAANNIDGINENLILTLTGTTDYLLASTGTPPDASAEITINDPIGTISITPTTSLESVVENLTSSKASFTISTTRPGGPQPAITVYFSLASSSTATANVDYTAVTTSGIGSATIPENQSQVEVNIVPISDGDPEATETVRLNLELGYGYLVNSASNSAFVEIIDDEPVVSISKITDITEGENNKNLFTVSYVGNLFGSSLTIPLTFGGTASTSDYTATPMSVVFSGNTKSIPVAITAINDGDAEVIETITATIPVNNALYFRGATVTAQANITDVMPLFTLAATNTIEGGTPGKFTITSTPAPVKKITVGYIVELSSTATPGAVAGGTADYQTISGTVDVTTATTDILITAFQDSIYEAPEFITITLIDSNPPTFTKADSSPLAATVSILDAMPAITQVSSSTLSGTYTAGTSIPIVVLFDNPITVTGSPTLLLETGTSDAVATFSSSSGASLTFTYVVRSTDESANLDYQSIAALSLNAGTIKKLGTSVDAYLGLPLPASAGSLSFGFTRVINGGSSSGKPTPGAVSKDGGGGCGLGSGFAVFATLCIALGIRLRTSSRP